MAKARRALALLALITGVLTPAPGRAAGEIITNPFGNLTAQIVQQPTGATPGKARLTIVTANGAAFSGGSTIFFGLRIMGSEDQELAGFSLPNNNGCIVSDFSGAKTSGSWQGGPVFGAQTPLGSANSHMRMIGGFIKKSCGNIIIDVTFRTRPLVTFYAAFFGYTAAPWHDNYDESPWIAAPTGGDAGYENWWDLWGTFDTLGYSNACTNVTGTTVTCG